MNLNHNNIERKLTIEVLTDLEIKTAEDLDTFVDFLADNNWECDELTFSGKGIVKRFLGISSELIGESAPKKAKRTSWKASRRG